jgi:hypothetical protein
MSRKSKAIPSAKAALQREAPEQLDLIDVLPKNIKAIRKAIQQRDQFHDEHLVAKQNADDMDETIWKLVQEAGGKLGADGTLTLKLGEDEVLTIKQAPARLTIKVKSPKAAKDDAITKEAQALAGDNDGVGKTPDRLPDAD